MCPKNCTGGEIDQTRKRYEMQPFKFHRNNFSDDCSPLLQALRMNQQNLVKKFDRLDSESKHLRDGQNRSLLRFAVDTCNKSVVKMAYELNSKNLETGLVYHVILQMLRDSNSTQTKRKQILEFLLSVGGSADDTIGIGESNIAIHGDVVKDFIAIEFCAFMGDTSLFELLLEKSSKCNENYCIGIALSKGNLGIIDSLVKRRVKLGKPMLSRHEIGPVLDVACNSPWLSTMMIGCLLKICPDAVFNNVNTNKNVRLVGCSMEWNIDSTGTTLGSLLSNGAKKHKSEIEKVGKFLIKHGIDLENDDSGGDKDTERHIGCEAYYSAVQHEYYDVASLILETTGHAIWKCAFLNKKCHYFQKQKESEVAIDGQTSNQETQIEALKKHLRMGCQRHVPEIFLKKLLTSGKDFLPKMSKTTYEVQAYEDDISFENIDDDKSETTSDEESLSLYSDEERSTGDLDGESEPNETKTDTKKKKSIETTKKEADNGKTASIETTDENERSPKTRKKDETVHEEKRRNSAATIVKKFSFLLSAIDGHEIDISRLLKFVPELYMCKTFFKHKRFQEPGNRSTDNSILLTLALCRFFETQNKWVNRYLRNGNCGWTLLHYVSYTDNVQLIKALQEVSLHLNNTGT